MKETVHAERDVARAVQQRAGAARVAPNPLHASPRMLAQRARIEAAYGSLAQRAGGLEHEAPSQARAAGRARNASAAAPLTSVVPAVRQRVKESRAADPYDIGGDSPQVHHIIAHSRLTGAMDKLDETDQAEVKRAFLPELSSITLRQLLNINDRLQVSTTDPAVEEKDRTTDKKGFYDSMTWVTAAINTLNDGQVTINHPAVGFNNTTLAAWKASYARVKQGGGPLVGDPATFWHDLQDAYAEWAGGNIFFGAQKRVEPGGSSLEEFDSDARYFRDPVHVASLQTLATRLAGAQGLAEIKAVLMEVAALTRDAGPGPKNDRAKWFDTKDSSQKALIVSLLEPGARKTYLQGKAGPYSVLPIPYLIERIEAQGRAYEAARPTAAQTRAAWVYLHTEPANAAVQPAIHGLTFRRTEGRHGPRIHVGGQEAVAELPINKGPQRMTLGTMHTLLQGQLHEVASRVIRRLRAEVGV